MLPPSPVSKPDFETVQKENKLYLASSLEAFGQCRLFQAWIVVCRVRQQLSVEHSDEANDGYSESDFPCGIVHFPLPLRRALHFEPESCRLISLSSPNANALSMRLFLSFRDFDVRPYAPRFLG
jgi:hypothetical protein